jgi:hypothetical protein
LEMFGGPVGFHETDFAQQSPGMQSHLSQGWLKPR